jgi:circadian clock protein KaiC
VFISFEQSPAQLVRNMASVGIGLGRWVEAGLLQMWSERATAHGLESHLGHLERMLDDTAPSVVALDAIASMGHVGSVGEVASAVARELDLIKARGITAVLTTLTHDMNVESSALEVSSLIDTWLLVRNVESDAERNRLLFVIKSRGTEHSNQVPESVLTARGAQLVDVSVGPAGVVTGSARAALEAQGRDAAARHEQEIEARRAALARRSAQVDGQIALLRAQFADEAAALDREIARESHEEDLSDTAHRALVEARGMVPRRKRIRERTKDGFPRDHRQRARGV